MSTWIQVFASGHPSFDEFARDVSAICDGVALSASSAVDGFELSAPGFFGRLHRHPYESDRQLPLAEYPFVVEFRVGFGTDRTDERPARGLATKVFESLKEKGRYRLLVTFDLQHRLDAFEPSAEWRT